MGDDLDYLIGPKYKSEASCKRSGGLLVCAKEKTTEATEEQEFDDMATAPSSYKKLEIDFP